MNQTIQNPASTMQEACAIACAKRFTSVDPVTLAEANAAALTLWADALTWGISVLIHQMARPGDRRCAPCAPMLELQAEAEKILAQALHVALVPVAKASN